ncbi:MAG TPA: dTMP kinase [Thermodesulfobacteriota bacterium]|nr:dTMP kinase [Thermodesulfobacteriota bacterium]
MGVFITFEGIEGCGKTTQIGRLTSYLKSNQLPFLVTREPGGTPFGEKIRQILLSSENAAMDPDAELLLYAAARVQHFRNVIQPATREGKIVVCDRFADATVAYQGFGRGLDLAWIQEIHARSTGSAKPDLTFLLDLPVQEGLRRAWKRIEQEELKEDRFEKEAVEFHERVRQGYLTLARREPARFVVLAGERDEETLHMEIVSRISSLLRGGHGV